MLEQLITYLSSFIETGQPDSVHVYGLAHRLRRIEEGKTKEFPAIYCANDEYHNIEHDIPFLYIRQRAAISESESNDSNAPSGCDDTIIRTYPMTLVGYIPKNIYNKDNAYSDERISGNIANTIDILSWKVLMTALQVSDINLNIRNIDTDRWSVWSKEYREIGMAARLDHAYFSIDFDLSVTAVQSCLRNYECGDEPINPNPCSNLKSTAILKDTDGNIISVTLIPAGTTADILAPDGVVENSNATFSLNVPSGGLEILPNPDISVNAVVEGQIVSQEPVLVTLDDGTNPITPDSVILVANTLGITILPAFSTFDPDYRKVLLTAQGNGIAIPSAPVRTLQNQLMIDMKANGSYAKADIMYIFAHDAGSAFGLINWKNPLRHFAQIFNAVALIPNVGYSADGVSGYISTRYNPAVDGINYTLNNASRYFYMFTGNPVGTQEIDGMSSSNNLMNANSGSPQRINSGGSIVPPYVFTTNKEMKSIHRATAIEQQMFQAKITEVRATNSTIVSNDIQLIFRAAANTGELTSSFYMMGASMIAENDDIVDDFDAYLNAL